MSKVAILVPNMEMRDLAVSLENQYSYLDFVTNEVIETDAAANRAIELEQQGVDVIVCRGLQALLIKKAVKIPLVEIRITTQELGMLIVDLKKALGVHYPKIAVIVNKNLLGNTDVYSEIFGAEIMIYKVDDSSQFDQAFALARDDGAQAFIGGFHVFSLATAANYPTRFLRSGIEGISRALANANSIAYAMDLEKNNTAQMQTLLDYAFEGIIQINSEGIIERTNTTMARILGKKAGNLVGKPIEQAVKKLNFDSITAALSEGKETFGQVLEFTDQEVVVNVAPIVTSGSVSGAILTFLESSSVQRIGSRMRQELFQRGFVTRYNFENVIHNSKEIKALISTAQNLAKFDAPILLTGEPGVGKNIFARCLHNDSLRRENGFVQAMCSGYESSTLDSRLFGDSASNDSIDTMTMVELAQDGTLHLADVEALSPELQYKVYLLTQGQYYRNGQNRPLNLNVRVIASSSKNLLQLVQQGKFREDLYYALSILVLDIPPLRMHKDDILDWVDYFMDMYRKKYTRYIQLNQNTYDLFKNYNWPGNLTQVRTVCERIVLLSNHRTADTVFVQRQLEQIHPNLQKDADRIIVYRDKHAVEISELLKKHNGNREKVAAELGISKTTLWRKMKKFGIGADFSLD